MGKLKVENISNVKLDFFLKQNNQDVRVLLNADESTWCDSDSNTKSMILYERKQLIRLTEEADLVAENSGLIAPQLISITPSLNLKNPFEEPPSAEVEIPTENSDSSISQESQTIKDKKAPKGKRRGPKKKRGPKPGAAKKKKKLAEKLAKESKNNDSENI